ncbi:hypothetical protein [Micromonospora nigra]|uniref:hypothetical protein n=1 Tax=Micromonospora nigra TaxID=145857 RepID=UPI001112E18A|nr:hypothetical protein [Micromonospora nigra]
MTARPAQEPAAWPLTDRSARGSAAEGAAGRHGSGRRVSDESSTRSGAPVVDVDFRPPAEPVVVLPEVAGAATDPAPRPGAKTTPARPVVAALDTLRPATVVRPVSGVLPTVRPALPTVRPALATVRPALATVVGAVSSVTEAVMTPVARLVGVIAPTLPGAPVCPDWSAPPVGGPMPCVPPDDLTSGVPAALPRQAEAPEPSSAPPSAVGTPPAAGTGVVPGPHRTSTGRPGAGHGSTPGPTSFPQRPGVPGSDGVTWADGGSGPTYGLTLDVGVSTAATDARPDISPGGGRAGRFPGVAARPG